MTYDPRVPSDELGDIVASQAAGYRHIYDFKSGRRLIARKARRQGWSAKREEDETALFDLQYGSIWGRNTSRLQQIVLEALERRDAVFFEGLSEALRRGTASIWRKTTPLERFMLAHWVEKLAPWPALCLLTDINLTQVCIQELDQANLTKSAVIKVRQNLGLVPSTYKLRAERRQGEIVGFKEVRAVDKFES